MSDFVSGVFWALLTMTNSCYSRKMRSEQNTQKRRIAAREKRREKYAADPEKIKAEVRAWRARHPERVKAAVKLKYALNKEARKAKARETYANNPEPAKRRAKQWHEANPEAAAAIRRNRKARVRAAEGFHTKEDIARIQKDQNGLCAYCPAGLVNGFHIDHIIPITGGGTNWPRNLQLTCPKCNIKKRDADPVDFARRIGLLI